MSFLDKFKGRGQRRAADEADELGYDEAYPLAEELAGAGGATATLDMSAMSPPTLSQDSSIISEATPSELPGDFAETRVQGADGGAAGGLPVIGNLPAAEQQRVLGGVLFLGLIGLVLATVLSLNSANRGAGQVAATGDALMQAQRLAKSVSLALVGNAGAFAELRESAGVLTSAARGLQAGNEAVEAAPGDVQPLLEPLMPLVDKAEKGANAVLAQEKNLVQAGEALRAINRQSADLLEIADNVATLKLQAGAGPAEIAAAGQLVMLTQRIGKSANEFLSIDGVSPEAVFLLGKDLNAFREIAQGLLDGSSELRLPGTSGGAAREQLQKLLVSYDATRSQAGAVVDNLQGMVAAREAQTQVLADSEPLRKGLQAVQAQLQTGAGLSTGNVLLILGSVLLALLGIGGLVYVYLQDQRARAAVADAQRDEAERLEQEAKRVNDANQAAILRLMNELQTVAEGDLTQQATVTEDITGAIADSVNYTVEELRTLVSQVQDTVGRVTETTQQVENTSTELLAASDEQLREIRETGESVLQMAGRINDVSAQATNSAQVARQSLVAAESGLQAVQNAIGGMNQLRDQIQDTSKRIKRLGESSQEIGEITELISDITEQTNVLALNAAIQAASAGEAGRGFSVVAEEVQRLAERSGDATKQIAALVKTIQTDTQDAVAAMERSTQGVVEGAKLSDNAGTALGEIDRVSRQLAELIEAISNEASREAQSANVVAANIQHIFAVTEQTGEGTRSTATLVRELSKSAEELKASVARFKVG